MAQNEDLDLEEQLAILGVDLGVGATSNVSVPPVQTAQSVTSSPAQNVTTEASIPAPFTPENPTNTGVVTNSVVEQPKTVEQSVSAPEVVQQVQAAQTAVAQQTTVVRPTTVKSAQQSVSRPVQQSAPVANNDELVFIDLAKAVNNQKTPWLKLKDGERSRIMILDLSKTIPMKVHYLKGLGYFKCLSGYTPEGWLDHPAGCCRKMNELGQLVPRMDDQGNEVKAKNRYLLPVIEYPVDKNNHNSIIPGQTPQLKMWNMNAVEWGDLITAIQGCADNPDDLSTADLSNIDFALFKDTNSRFKTISITTAPKCFRFQYETQIQAEMSKLTQEFFKDALKEARKVIRKS